MRDGDIYRWAWADLERDRAGSFGEYHCKSRIAVFKGGHLYDTFWGDSPTDNSFLREDDVSLEFLGNWNEMVVLNDNPEYYRSEDLVNMNHSNNSRAPIYIKPGTKRDAQTMGDLVSYKIERAKSAARSAEFDLKRLSEAQDEIASGNLDVYL